MNDLYISYRRGFSFSIALALFHTLHAQGCDVFMDVNRLDDRDALDLSQIEAHEHFLVILTPTLIELLQNADDPTRLEIELAVARRRNIVPLLTNGFSFNSAILPAKVNVLRRYFGLTVTPDTLTQDTDDLQERLAQSHFFGTIIPTPPEQQQAVAERITEALSQPFPTPNELQAEVLFNHALMRARQDHAGKRADYDEVLRLNPGHTYARFERALERRRSADEAGAFEDYSEIVRQNPLFYRAYNNRAELCFTRGYYEQALADYEQATAIRPNFVMSLAGKAVTFYVLGRVDEALSLWKSLLARDDRFYDVAWVGRELRLPAAMIDEMNRLNTRLRTPSHAPDD